MPDTYLKNWATFALAAVRSGDDLDDVATHYQTTTDAYLDDSGCYALAEWIEAGDVYAETVGRMIDGEWEITTAGDLIEACSRTVENGHVEELLARGLSEVEYAEDMGDVASWMRDVRDALNYGTVRDDTAFYPILAAQSLAALRDAILAAQSRYGVSVTGAP